MTDRPSPSTPLSPESSPAPKPSKRRKWTQRIRTLVVGVLFLAVLSRILFAVLFPTVLRRVAGFYGLDCSYDRLELSMLSGDAGLWHLTLTPKSGGEPIFESEYVRGDVSTLNLLRGRLAVWRVEADGVTLLVNREPDGSIPLLKLITSKTSSTAAAAPPPTVATSQPAKAIDLSAPLRIDALRLTHIRTRIRDKSVTPPLDATFTMNLRLSNLGWTNTPVHFAIDMDGDPILDGLHVEGDGRGDDKSLQATLQASVAGLRLHPLAPYLRALGILPTANEISLKAGGRLTLEPSHANPGALAGSLNLDALSAIADGEVAAGLDHLSISADSIDLHAIRLASLVIDNAQVSVRRSADGRIRFGGVEYIGAPPSAKPTTAPAAVTPMSLPVVTLGEFSLQHLRIGFHDDAIAPPVAVAADVDQLSVKNIIFDPKQPDAVLQLAGAIRAPGLLSKGTFEGTATPFAEKKTLDLKLRANGISPTAIEPYLNAVGITSRLHDASFACDVSANVSLPAGAIAANAKVTGIKLADGGDLIVLDHANISGASYRLDPPLVRLKDVQIAGPVLSIEHEKDGSLAAAGFATKHRAPTTAIANAAPSATTTTQPAVAMTLAAVEIDHFTWKGIDIHYSDQTLNPPAQNELSDAGVELDNIFIDSWGATTAPAVTSGTVRAWAKVPNVIDSFSVEGRVSPSASDVVCDLTAKASGLSGAVIAPYLKTLGIEPTLHDGAFDAQVKADLSRKGISLDAEQVHFLDGGEELAGVDAVKIDRASFSKNLLNIGNIEIVRPRVGVTREADDGLLLAGVRLTPSLFHHPAAPVVATSVVIKPTTAPATAPSLPIEIALHQFAVKDATLKWTDLAATPQVQTSAVANLSVAELYLGKSAAPVHLHADVHVEGSIDSAAVDGTIIPSLDAPSLKLSVAVNGIRTGSLAAYLPRGFTVPLQGGQFRTAIEAGLLRNPAGGVGAKLIITDLDYRDQGQAQPLLKVDSFRAVASRIDSTDKVFAIDEISSAGVETSASRLTGGAIGLMGVDLKAGDAAAPTTQAAASPVSPQPPSSAAPVDVATLLAQARQQGAAITVEKLDLNLKRLALSDNVRPQAAPLIISDLHFRNMSPINWAGRDAESRAPTPFRLDCTLDPVVGAVTVLIQVTPLVSAPTATFDLTAADIRGDGLTELIPELKPYIDGSSLESGQFHAHAETQFRVNRRGNWDFDLSRGLSADLDVKEIAFRAAPGGPVLAGLDNIHSDAIHITPATGELHVKTLEITNPIGRIVRQSDGIHVVGLVVKLPKTQPDTQPTTAPSPEPIQEVKAEPAKPPLPKKPTAEIRVDQLLINNVDFIAEDQTLTPPLIFPLNSLDVEVRDFSNLAPYEDRPIRFNALVSAGKVPLPGKITTAGHEENRELFAQASASGMIGLYPTSHGWIKTSLSGLELAGLKGAAKEAGVTLAGGVFDSTADAKLPGDGTIRTTSKFTFTDLSLAEPPNGPIFRLLHLPAPLDVVIGALQDDEGSITVPLDVPVKPGDLSVSTLVGPAVGAFGSIVVTAIASAPLKAAGGIGDMLGLGGNKKRAPEAPVVLTFEPGDTGLSAADQSEVAALAERMAKDKSLNLVVRHDLGGGDLTIANERANPSAQDARNLAEQLRQQQLDTLQKRSALAGTARAELAWGSTQTASATIEQLRSLDQQVAQNDDALDRLYGLLRPGADRQAARRTRGACLAYGRERLDAVKQELKALGVDDKDRVHLANPQFAEVPGDEGGKIVVTLVPKKKS